MSPFPKFSWLTCEAKASAVPTNEHCKLVKVSQRLENFITPIEKTLLLLISRSQSPHRHMAELELHWWGQFGPACVGENYEGCRSASNIRPIADLLRSNIENTKKKGNSSKGQFMIIFF